MKSSYAILFVFSMLVIAPSLSMAHGGGAGAAMPKHDMKDMGKSHETESAGHAATLGKPADVARATRTIEVVMGDNMRFEPESIDIRQGETVRFAVRNSGNIKHEMVLGTMTELKKHAALMAKFPEMEHEDPNAVTVEPGKIGEFAWTFTKSGTFDFACLVPGHFEAGMKGKLRVRK